MANIETITKAKIYQLSLEKILGVKPEIVIGDQNIRIYYTPEKLITVQKNIEKMIETKSNIQVDFIPMFLPILIKKFSVPLLSIFAGGIILGKKL